MNDMTLPASTRRHSLVEKFASRYSIEPTQLLHILKHTAFKVKEGEVSNEQMAALLVVADHHGLNPFTREIFAFPDKQNGIVPVVSVDGWTRIINEHPQMDGVEFRYSPERVEPGDKRFPGLKWVGFEWIESVIYRKDRLKPVVVREFFEEVYREPFTFRDGNKKESAWQTHNKRFHRHKALIQGGRLAFGFAGIYDEDEAQRIIEAKDVTHEQQSTIHVQMPREKPAEKAPEPERPAESHEATPGPDKPVDEPTHEPVEGTVETRAEQQAKRSVSPPAKASQLDLIRKKAEQAGIGMADIAKRFNLPVEGTLDGITTAQGNDILSFLRDPS